MKIIGEILFAAINIAIAYYHAGQFAKGETISHSFWAFVIAVIIIGFTWVEKWDFLFAGCLIAERIWLFNPALNLIRHKPFFYVATGKTAHWFDDTFGKYYQYIFIVAILLFIVAQFFLH